MIWSVVLRSPSLSHGPFLSTHCRAGRPGRSGNFFFKFQFHPVAELEPRTRSSHPVWKATVLDDYSTGSSGFVITMTQILTTIAISIVISITKAITIVITITTFALIPWCSGF